MNINGLDIISICFMSASLILLLYLGLREFIFSKDTENNNKKEESKNNDNDFEYKIIYGNKLYDTSKSELLLSLNDFYYWPEKILYYKSPNNNFFKLTIIGSDINFYPVDDFEMENILKTHPDMYMKVFPNKNIEEA